MEALPRHLDRFATLAYANHDGAHDKTHALRVYARALEIVRAGGICLTREEVFLFPYVMVGHDMLDHKLAARGIGLSRDTIRRFYVKHLGEAGAKEVLHIHDNCSWSKRHTSVPYDPARDTLRILLQDADWLEALGEVGLQRCIEYTRAIGGEVPSDVCMHIREKLLLVPRELHYAPSRAMAADLVAPLERYLYAAAL